MHLRCRCSSPRQFFCSLDFISGQRGHARIVAQIDVKIKLLRQELTNASPALCKV